MLVKQDICTQQTQTNKPLLIIPMISNGHKYSHYRLPKLSAYHLQNLESRTYKKVEGQRTKDSKGAITQIQTFLK